MSKDELLNYIKKELDSGAPKETIASYLHIGGWPMPEIEKAFLEVQKSKKGALFGLNPDVDLPKTSTRLSVILWNTLSFIALLLIGFLILAYIVGGEA